MKKVVIVLILFFLVSSVSANCEEGQIDLNSASLVELQKIVGIGPSYAEQIVELRKIRLFSSVDDLERVYGIAAGRLGSIKENNPGLICTGGEFVDVGESIVEEDLVFEKVQTGDQSSVGSGNVIKVAPKDIKSENSTEVISKDKYAIIGFSFFCILILSLFFVRRVKNKKNVLE